MPEVRWILDVGWFQSAQAPSFMTVQWLRMESNFVRGWTCRCHLWWKLIDAVSLVLLRVILSFHNTFKGIASGGLYTARDTFFCGFRTCSRWMLAWVNCCPTFWKELFTGDWSILVKLKFYDFLVKMTLTRGDWHSCNFCSIFIPSVMKLDDFYALHDVTSSFRRIRNLPIWVCGCTRGAELGMVGMVVVQVPFLASFLIYQERIWKINKDSSFRFPFFLCQRSLIWIYLIGTCPGREYKVGRWAPSCSWCAGCWVFCWSRRWWVHFWEPFFFGHFKICWSKNDMFAPKKSQVLWVEHGM